MTWKKMAQWTYKQNQLILSKGNIRIVIRNNYLESFFILALQKGCAKLLKLFLKGNKEQMLRNQPVGCYLMGLKIKFLKSKQRDYKIYLFDQDQIIYTSF